MVHTNIIRFVAAKLANTGSQPVCQSISSIIADIPGKGILHIIEPLALLAKSIVIKFAQLGAGL